MAGSFAFTDANTLLMCARSDLFQIQEQCKNGSADRCVNTNSSCPSSLPLQYMEHSLTGYGSTRGRSGSATYEFDWTPPASAQGNITFYVSANAANADIGVNGDHIYNTKFTIAPQNGISLDNVLSASAFGGYTAIAPGSWVELYGTGLSGTTRQWGGGDFTGTKAPTSLDNVKVTIGGQNAFVYYISPLQINAQAPSNLTAGAQPVVVTNGSSSTPARNITVNALQPGLLAPPSFVVSGKQHVTAQFADNSFVLPPGAIAGQTTRQARPGDTIVIYGIGFGPVQDSGGQDIPAGTIVTASNKLAKSFSMSIGGQPAVLAYEGLAPNFVGLYQFNVTVPDIADNDFTPLTYTLDGSAGPQVLYLAVKK